MLPLPGIRAEKTKVQRLQYRDDNSRHQDGNQRIAFTPPPSSGRAADWTGENGFDGPIGVHVGAFADILGCSRGSSSSGLFETPDEHFR